MNIQGPVQAFISYSHLDEDLRQELEAHLKLLQRQGIVQIWTDRKIVAGGQWADELDERLAHADLVLLLVSAYFLASDYCYDKELVLALARHAEGKALVIPVFLRPCDWKDAPFVHLQGLPSDCVPVTAHSDRHQAWAEVSTGIRRAIAGLRGGDSGAVRRAPSTGGPLADYLAERIRDFERLPWKSRSIPLLAADHRGRTVDLADYLQAWVSRAASPALFLLGDTGSGKTWALKRLAHDLALVGADARQGRWLPIYMELTKVTHGEGRIDLALIVPGLRDILGEAGDTRCVFLLDGFDEVAFHDGAGALNLLRRVVKAAPAGTRFIVGCRTQAFESTPQLIEIEFEAAADELPDRTDRAIAATLRAVVTCTIQPLGLEMVDAFLGRGPASDQWTSIERERYLELLRNPVMLALFERAMPFLADSNEVPTIARIYELAMQAWLRRDPICALAEDGPGLLQRLLSRLAGVMFPNGFVELNALTTSLPMDLRSQDLINSLINSNLLQLNRREELRFCHRSVWEFYFAKEISRQMANYDASLLAQANLVYGYTINCFLVPMLAAWGPAALDERAATLKSDLLSRASPTTAGGHLAVVRCADFAIFLSVTGWRRNTGYGVWGTLRTQDGTKPFTGGVTGIGHTPDLSSRGSDDPVTGVSWYDAWLFCRWIGGSLPGRAEIGIGADRLDSEWTGDWHDELHGLMAVRRQAECVGMNADLRASGLGFRVRFDAPPIAGHFIRAR